MSAWTWAALASLVGWLGLALHPARPWDLKPVAEDRQPPPPPERWPSVRVLVPARNEAAMLPETLPSLTGQDYSGEWAVTLVDDRSEDGTAFVAGAVAPGVAVVDGLPLPAGWIGKVWALEQGFRSAADADYLLLTDADIHHQPGSLRRLVAESEVAGLALNSRMARLRTETAIERLLIPAFAFFFACLYPMRWVNRQRRPFAAAAGGCILIRRDALVAAGGFAAIRNEIIDDVNLARVLSRHGALHLATSRADVRSLRPYGTIGPIWRMVRRTAFDQLGYSWLLLAATVAILVALFAGPPALTMHGLIAGAWLEAGLAAAAWAVAAVVYLPAVRHYALAPVWAAALPVAGVLYGAMTVDSAARHLLGQGRRW